MWSIVLSRVRHSILRQRSSADDGVKRSSARTGTSVGHRGRHSGARPHACSTPGQYARYRSVGRTDGRVWPCRSVYYAALSRRGRVTYCAGAPVCLSVILSVVCHMPTSQRERGRETGRKSRLGLHCVSIKKHSLLFPSVCPRKRSDSHKNVSKYS